MNSRIVAIIDWREAALLKENANFLEYRRRTGTLKPADGKLGATRYRSLMVYEDGTCLLQRLSAAAVARRCGGLQPIRKKVK